MNIIIGGAGGFLGRALRNALTDSGHMVNALLRKDFDLDPGAFAAKLGGHDVIINLAGVSILKRWTPAYKNEIISSRVNTTRKIAEAINSMGSKPALFISTSATGIYPDGEVCDERTNDFSGSFLGRLCVEWEKEAIKAEGSTRLVIFRLGIVLDKHQGALRRMLPAFRLGLGAVVASGKQPFPWIHIRDLLKAYLFIIDNRSLSGVFNLTSPNPITNAEFSKTLGMILKRPVLFSIPGFVLKLIYGEAVVTIAGGQAVYPWRLLNEGFEFEYTEIKEALIDLV